ncbi:MAG: hypothetical protein LWX56_15020 [Ignavibacteria bacterium]|nr:hypothetical protein [Ignavibacteria bacterium]
MLHSTGKALTRALCILSLILICSRGGYAQSTAGEDAKLQYRYLIDMPTSGVLERGMVAISNDIMPGGVLIARFEAGVLNDLNIGVSFGGANIIGSGSPRWYKLPCASLRYKLTQENINGLPELTIGFDSQGKGEYLDSVSRYAIKSPGLFLAGSKNFAFLGFLTLHGALNYSFENANGNFMNLQVGAEKTIGSKLSLLAEYDFAFNDNNSDANISKGNGYMNIGIRWAPAEGFTLGLDLRDMLNNKKWAPGAADRAVHLEFIKKI